MCNIARLRIHIQEENCATILVIVSSAFRFLQRMDLSLTVKNQLCEVAVEVFLNSFGRHMRLAV